MLYSYRSYKTQFCVIHSRRIITQLTGFCTFLTLLPGLVIIRMEISHKRATRFLKKFINDKSYKIQDLGNRGNVCWVSYFYSQKSLKCFVSINYSDLHCVKRRILKRHTILWFLRRTSCWYSVIVVVNERSIRHTEATHARCELLVQLCENFPCVPFPRSAS